MTNQPRGVKKFDNRCLTKFQTRLKIQSISIGNYLSTTTRDFINFNFVSSLGYYKFDLQFMLLITSFSFIDFFVKLLYNFCGYF